ncbi:macrophage erythroblast attacher-like [Plakobranchus ocellatus]|uniref:E3 ubiquitin-protein transferase MAEA n=1 Tax=Plakobranchus ocellatus TaxID=259542 RepID=A0AAV3YJK7_9GAST|nr:macrophage erythroblast attacher-like [Plakobranchus ocellatus]
MADVRTLEHSTLKVPYELLNKQFRASQKVIDREVSKLTSTAGDLEKKIQDSALTVRDVTSALSTMVDNLSMLKRKAEESIQEELGATRVIKRRLEHLQERDAYGAKDGPPPITWQKSRLDRMLVEYFLRAGYYNSALKLARHSGIEDLTNIELFMLSKEIEDCLAKGDTKPCLSWCADNRSKLRKMKSTLEFNIRKHEFIEMIREDKRMDAIKKHEFIEMIREDKRMDAIKHSRKYFSSVEPNQVADVQRLMGMLAFNGKSPDCPYTELLNSQNWQKLVLQFRQENFKLHQLNSTSVFTATLQAGLSALKTPHCYKEDGNVRNPDCPVCSTNMNELAHSLPFAHCSNSKLVCNITGFALNEHNPPMMLPNGRIYGLRALENMADDNEGRVVCPRTREIFHVDDLEKVFVM